mmetsp:Transcript_22049/g.59277  ORF Transcript_22049/g.59277 Transcript_22049/m.59277 type:complete len:334 (-) Transcript_22049:126-1127(-)
MGHLDHDREVLGIAGPVAVGGTLAAWTRGAWPRAGPPCLTGARPRQQSLSSGGLTARRRAWPRFLTGASTRAQAGFGGRAGASRRRACKSDRGWGLVLLLQPCCIVPFAPDTQQARQVQSSSAFCCRPLGARKTLSKHVLFPVLNVFHQRIELLAPFGRVRHGVSWGVLQEGAKDISARSGGSLKRCCQLGGRVYCADVRWSVRRLPRTVGGTQMLCGLGVLALLRQQLSQLFRDLQRLHVLLPVQRLPGLLSISQQADCIGEVTLDPGGHQHTRERLLDCQCVLVPLSEGRNVLLLCGLQGILGVAGCACLRQRKSLPPHRFELSIVVVHVV